MHTHSLEFVDVPQDIVIDATIDKQRFVNHVFLGESAFTDAFHVGLHLGAQVGFGHVETHGLVAFDQRQAEFCRSKRCTFLDDIATILDRFDVLSNGGVGA